VSGAAARSRPGASVLSSSAVMAAGTVVSRLSGFVRSMLLAAALGTQLHADVFTIANTIPNMLYILLAGGVFNAVLVPQLVRAMKGDADGGAAYTNRIITLTGLFLAGVTALLVVAAPLLMRLYLADAYFTDALTAQRDSVIDFARLCLPQVFFYGMFVLVGQVLNSRERFGPMMWAPIANNVISIGVLLVYLLVYGAASGAGLCGGFSTSQEWLLGMGATVGIVAQFLVLVPYLRATGFRFRPRFDFRDSGLGHTLRLGGWTVAFVIVNQIAYTVVVRLASSGTADAVGTCGSASSGAGTGYTIYSGAFLLATVPHAIVTVSLATATLPRLSAFAADGDLPAVGRQVADTTRTALAMIVPFALLLPAIALPLSNIVWGYAAASHTYRDFAVSLALFAPGLVLFTVHYLMLRGFYALERTRTVFWVQCAVAATNITLAILVTSRVSPADTAPGLVTAYAGSYAVGALSSYLVLRRVLGGLETPALLRFGVRILAAGGLAGLAAWGWRRLLDDVWVTGDGKLQALVLVASTGAVDLVVLLLVARALRITELNEVVGLVRRRLGR
jgi:putative peptidoglycan lipid II flippase